MRRSTKNQLKRSFEDRSLSNGLYQALRQQKTPPSYVWLRSCWHRLLHCLGLAPRLRLP